jgi:hypothetical protein
MLRTTELRIAEAWISNDVRADRSGERWVNAIATRTFTTEQGE